VVLDHGKANGILGCDIHDGGGTAIHITGGNRSTLEPAGNYVRHCHIHHYAQRKMVYRPAVRLHGVGHRVAHNYDCASSTAIVGNVFFDMLKPAFIGGGRDNRVANNVFVECETPVERIGPYRGPWRVSWPVPSWRYAPAREQRTSPGPPTSSGT
jgi:hypothetical protein